MTVKVQRKSGKQNGTNGVPTDALINRTGIFGYTPKTTCHIHADFVKYSSEIKRFLKQIKQQCDAFDQNNPAASSEEVRKFIDSIKSNVFNQLNTHFEKLLSISRNFTSEEYSVHQAILQHFIVPVFALQEANLNHLIYFKPFGYAGDFMTSKMICEGGYPGSTTYGKLVNRYTLEQPLAKAHINRKTYLKRFLLRTLARTKPTRTLRIASLACGPAHEIIEIIEGNQDLASRATFTCLDAEQKALNYIQNRLAKLQIKSISSKTRVEFIQANILSLVRRGNLLLPRQNLIYCAGFFDYISNSVVKRCLETFIDSLEPGGTLICVNVTKQEEKIYLEMGGEWYLHGRTAEEIRSLIPSYRRIASKHVFLDPKIGMNAYLVIRLKE